MANKDLKKYLSEYRSKLDKRRIDTFSNDVEESVETMKTAIKQEKANVSEKSMLTGIRNLRTQFNDVLGQLERQFQDHYQHFLDIKKTIDSERRTLEEVYQIRHSIDTLKQLKAQIQKQQDFIDSIDAKKRDWKKDEEDIQQRIYEKEKELQYFIMDMEEKKKVLLSEHEQKSLQLEQTLNDKRIKFGNEIDEKRHQHDQKALQIEQLQKEDQLKTEKELENRQLKLEKEFDNKRLSFEKEVLEREANFSEKEMELAQLRTKSLSFPKEMADSLKKKEKEITDRLVLKYSHIIELNKKGNDADIKLYQHKLSMLEKKTQQQTAQLDALKLQLTEKSAALISVQKKSEEASPSLSPSTTSEKKPLSIKTIPKTSSVSSSTVSQSKPSPRQFSHSPNASEQPKIIRISKKR